MCYVQAKEGAQSESDSAGQEADANSNQMQSQADSESDAAAKDANQNWNQMKSQAGSQSDAAKQGAQSESAAASQDAEKTWDCNPKKDQAVGFVVALNIVLENSKSFQFPRFIS